MAENNKIINSTISKEDRNCWILNILIHHVAPTAVRKLFNDKIPPNDLASILLSNVKTIQDLVKRNIIKKHERDILVRIPGFKLPSRKSSPNKTGIYHCVATSSEDFDTTLMICILRSLRYVSRPSKGWANIPPVGENSLGANLTRIKEYRNQLCHRPKARINDKEFRKIWCDLTRSFSEISCGETDNIVSKIGSLHFEGCDRENLLSKIQKELREIRGDLQFHYCWKVNTANVLDDWRADLENFYETEGTKKVIEQLNTNNAVMITGNSGIGKTATMKYVSLLFEKTEYEVVLISSPNDIPTQRFPGRKQIFIIDDIIGKYSVDSVAVELWRRLYDRLRVIFKDKNVKLLSTLRRQLYADMSSTLFPIVFNSTTVDLESKELVLSSSEKKRMLEHYLERRKITEYLDGDEMLRICSCQTAFPLLCNLFTSNQEFLKMKSTFFQSPSIIFNEELNRLQIENKEVYCVLVLVVIFHLEELQTIFDINCEVEKIVAYNKILRACEVPENTGRKTLHRRLQSVAGTFVETTNIFKFKHDKLEETISSHFGSQFPDIMLQYCKLNFIRDRVRLEPTDDENILVLKESSYDLFSKRVIDEIMKGKFRDILLSEPMQCDKVIEHFAFCIKKHQMCLKDIENVSCNESFLPPQHHKESNRRDVSVSNRFALLEELQSRKKLFIHWVAAMGCTQLFSLLYKRPVNKKRKNLTTDLLHLAVSGGNIDVVKLLIDEGVDLKSYDDFGIPLLCKIAGTNRCDIAELLINKGADVNQTDRMCGWTPCFVATWFNEVHMLSFLLSKGASINKLDFRRRVPLVIAVVGNNTQAVSVLLKHEAKIQDKNEKVINSEVDIGMKFSVLLEVALNNNNHKIIQMLTNMKGKNLMIRVFPELIPTKDFMRKNVNMFITTIRSDDLKSPFWKDFIEICDAINTNDILRLENIFTKEEPELIDTHTIFRGVLPMKPREKILATFDKNYLRFCPLHVSAACDNTTAAKVLIQNGADPFQRDVLGRTSIHFANSGAMLKTLLSTTDQPKYTSTFSLSTWMKRVLIFCVSFEIVPTVLKSLETPNIDQRTNVRDIYGNTPIHSIIGRTLDVDPKKCLDTVEILIDNGADINIRNNKGFLPIDYFKTVSLRFDESVIDRGESLLGGQQNKSFVRKEKWYLGILAAIFIALYILVSFYIAVFVCYRKEKSSASNNFQCLNYSQIFYVFFLPGVCKNIISNNHAIFISEVNMKALRSKYYSEKIFVEFSVIFGIVCILIRCVAFSLDNVYSTYIFFNVYCVLVCTFYCILLVPNPCRGQVRKYHNNCIVICVFKITLVSYLGVWILYLMLNSKFETSTISHNIVELYWSELLLFFLFKVLMLYTYFRLFVFRLIRPLLFIVFQPLFLYRQHALHLISIAYLLIYIFEILLLPFTFIFCGIPNR